MPKIDCRLKINRVMLTLDTPKPRLQITGQLEPMIRHSEAPDVAAGVDLDPKDPLVESLLAMISNLFEEELEKDNDAALAAASKKTAETTAGEVPDED